MNATTVLGGGASLPPSEGLSTAHISTPVPARPPKGSPSVLYAEGGNLLSVTIPSNRPTLGGGKRGKVYGFSRNSRKRMLRLVNSINRTKVEPRQALFVTLTYPAVWPSDPKVWAAHLQAFRMRLERRWGIHAVIWKKEPQRRGAPHFHLLLLCDVKTAAQVRIFRRWCSAAWYEVVGSGDAKHFRAGTQVETVRSWRGVVSYAAKYLGKESPGFVDQETGEVLATGRWWGVWNADRLPVELKAIEVSYKAAYRLRRVVLRLRHWRAKWRNGVTTFLAAQDSERLVRWATT